MFSAALRSVRHRHRRSPDPRLEQARGGPGGLLFLFLPLLPPLEGSPGDARPVIVHRRCISCLALKGGQESCLLFSPLGGSSSPSQTHPPIVEALQASPPLLVLAGFTFSSSVVRLRSRMLASSEAGGGTESLPSALLVHLPALVGSVRFGAVRCPKRSSVPITGSSAAHWAAGPGGRYLPLCGHL